MKYLDFRRRGDEIAAVDQSVVPQESGYGATSGYGVANGYGTYERIDEKQFLYQMLAGLRKRWYLIAAITMVATTATVFYVAQKPDYYKASARVQVNSESGVVGGRSESSSPIIISNPTSDPAYFATQLQTLEGSGLLIKVAANLDLENNQQFKNASNSSKRPAWQNVLRMFGLNEEAPSQSKSTPQPAPAKQDELYATVRPNNPADPEKYGGYAKQIKKDLEISPVRDSRSSTRETRLIDIQYVNADPEMSAKIANAIADAYVLQNLELKVQNQASVGDFLQKRVAELQASIRQGEERLLNYSKDNKILTLDSNQNTVVQRLTTLNQQLAAAENDRIEAQTAYEAARQNQMRDASAAKADPQVTGLETKLAELRQKLDQLKLEYTDEWWEVVQTKKQIETVESQLSPLRRRASDTQMAGLKEKLDEAAARESKLRTNFNQQRDAVMQQNEASINYKIIQQEIDTNKSLLTSLLQQSRENDVILNDTPNNVFVSERASVPTSPAGPDRAKNIILAFFVSLFLGCVLALVLNWLDDSVHHSSDIESTLGLPLLAAIPAAPTGIVARMLPKRLAGKRAVEHGENHYQLSVFERPEFTEAYLQMRTHLLLSRAGGPPRSILITSGQESEGKTITALNFAASLVDTNKRVLLIDADLRYPRIHLIKGLRNDHGLTSLLATPELTDETIERAIQKDEANGLFVMTAGEHSVAPTNLLSSDRMKQLLERLATGFDHVVIDSPPVLYFADSVILSTIVDSVVLVVRENGSSTQSVHKARRILLSVGASITGMVINGVSLGSVEFSKYHYYYGGKLPVAESRNGLQPLDLQ